jgi:hypothetical protein
MAAERIPIAELKKKLDAKANLFFVDVREAGEIKEGAIPRRYPYPNGTDRKACPRTA